MGFYYSRYAAQRQDRNMLTKTRTITLMSSSWKFPSLDMQIEILSVGMVTQEVL